MINMVNTPQGVVEARGVSLTSLVTAPRATEYELSLIFMERDGAVAGGLIFACDLFSRWTVAGWIDRYLSILHRMAQSPEDRLDTLIDPSHRSGAAERKGT
jgi:hypothetical protein